MAVRCAIEAGLDSETTWFLCKTLGSGRVRGGLEPYRRVGGGLGGQGQWQQAGGRGGGNEERRELESFDPAAPIDVDK